jgi:hypothetical protein
MVSQKLHVSIREQHQKLTEKLRGHYQEFRGNIGNFL